MQKYAKKALFYAIILHTSLTRENAAVGEW